ncbi:MAG: diguanylate cyclase [Myxococcales bacterium]|nr:diguanylate cyclase [Myxococcales bacterium]
MASGIRPDMAQTVVDTLREGVIVVDGAGVVQAWNAAAERIFGWSHAEAVGHKLSALVPDPPSPLSVPPLAAHFEHGEATASGEPREADGYRRDGTRFRMELSLLRTERNGERHVAGIVRDVTEREAAEALLAMRGRVARAVNQILRGFITASLWARKELYDEALEDLLGLTGSEFGFIGEILETPEGVPYLKAHAITDISWNQETRKLYRDNIRQGLEFRNLHNLFGVTVRTGEMVLANDPGSDLRSGGLPPGHPGLDSYLGLPIYAGGKLLGMVGVANRPGGYDEEVAESLKPFLGAIGTVIAGFQDLQTRRKAEQDLYRAQQRLRILAAQDGLTEIPNRHSLMDAIEDAFARSAELSIPFSVLFVDVDHVKRINDAHGHRAGDRVLRHLARILRETIRPSDIIGRYGGDAFVLGFLECDEPYAVMVAERLRGRIEGEPFPVDEEGAHTIPVTLSAGVASFDASAGRAGDLVNQAEHAAQEAKQAGRNRIHVHPRAPREG